MNKTEQDRRAAIKDLLNKKGVIDLHLRRLSDVVDCLSECLMDYKLNLQQLEVSLKNRKEGE